MKSSSTKLFYNRFSQGHPPIRPDFLPQKADATNSSSAGGNMRTNTFKAQNWLRPVLVAAIAVMMFYATQVKLFAQSDVECSGTAGTSCITFAGEPLEGPTNQLTSFVLQSLRPEVARMNANELFGADTSPVTNATSCLGVTEKKGNGLLLLKETVFATDRTNGRYNAVVPAEGNHGDWPPHLPLFQVSADQQAAQGECLITAEIAWRLMYRPQKPGTLTFEFELNGANLNEYEVMASQGGLGFFVSAVGSDPVTMTVNGETFQSLACSDCSAHTEALTTTIGAGVYSPETVAWFGEMAETSSPLVNMYVLPVKKQSGVRHQVTIQLTEEAFVNGKPNIALWFGRFDVPGFNTPAK